MDLIAASAAGIAALGVTTGYALSSRLHAGATGACSCGHAGGDEEGFDLLPMALGQRCPACGSPLPAAWILAAIFLGAAYVFTIVFTVRQAQSLLLDDGDVLFFVLRGQDVADLRVMIEGIALGFVFMAIAVDWRTQVLPEPLLLPGLWLVLLAAACGGGEGLVTAVTGGVSGYLCFTALSVAGRFLFGGDVLGPGDARLAGIVGAWAGLAIGDAIVIAGITGICVRLVSGQTRIALGPALAVGLLVTGAWGGNWSLFLVVAS